MVNGCFWKMAIQRQAGTRIKDTVDLGKEVGHNTERHLFAAYLWAAKSLNSCKGKKTVKYIRTMIIFSYQYNDCENESEEFPHRKMRVKSFHIGVGTAQLG